MKTFQRTGCGFSSQCPRKTAPKKIAKSIVGKSTRSVAPGHGIARSLIGRTPNREGDPLHGARDTNPWRFRMVVPLRPRLPIAWDDSTVGRQAMKAITVALVTDPADRSVFYRAR